MFDVAKHEFLNWLKTIDVDSLSEYETSFLSILLSDFEGIASKGIATGQRLKYLAQKFEELGMTTTKTIPSMKEIEQEEESVSKILSLDGGKFRGFDTTQHFSFNPRYTFFHGPNGSGKTSFCEALEYCMLGTIEEASARGISLDKYILHIGETKPNKPKLMCKYNSGKTQECRANYTKYRFGFIEKNRIDGFSHISASSVKTQTERLAALFGLSEFQDFVKGFSPVDTFRNDKYLKVTGTIKPEYEKAKAIIEEKEKRVKEEKNAIGKTQEELLALIGLLDVEGLESIDDVERYFSDPITGIIPRYSREANENKLIMLTDEDFKEFSSKLRKIIELFEGVETYSSQILSDVSAVNLTELYNAIKKIEAGAYSHCPVCLTPLDRVTVDPFKHADEELIKMQAIDSAKKEVRSRAKTITEQFEKIQTGALKLERTGIVDGINYELLRDAKVQSEDVISLDDQIRVIFAELRRLYTRISSDDMTKTIKEYNAKAIEHNSQYNEKLDKVQKEHKAIIEKNSFIIGLEKELERYSKELDNEKRKLDELTEKMAEEKKEIAFNNSMLLAYDSVVKNLTKYVGSLPVALSKDLSEKVREYYNYINDGDADFELVKELTLPVAANEKIHVKTSDGVSQDALQFLSEGHVKILGLSILLAKAVQEKMPFLVFDDIVNSIDDDHRNGVARLLIQHEDFSGMQMILTCHGEIFVTKLQNYVTKSNDMSRYMFLPADAITERGVFIQYQEAGVPIEMARKAFETGQLKECAAKCRQAVECFTGKLWKKLGCSKGISVCVRGPQSKPDLNSVVTALYSETDSKKVCGVESLHEDLGKLKINSTWDLLNKGVHYDESIPEFDRIEIKKLLELVEKINTEIQKFKPISANLNSLAAATIE